MGMSYLEGTCPKCGEKTREQSNTWAYGSPIRFCPRCKQEYLDKRWREVAIDGFDPRGTSPAYYLKCFVGCLVGLILSYGWYYYTTHYRGYYNTMNIAIIVVAAIGTIGCLGLAIYIGLGFGKKADAKYMEESKRRLRDADYVRKLQSYGYVIPAEYLVGITNSSEKMVGQQ